MVESLVALLWLTPLWFALLFLGELLVVQQAAISSVRHAVMMSHLADGALAKTEMANLTQSRYAIGAADAPWMPQSLRLHVKLEDATSLASPRQLEDLAQAALTPASAVTGGDFRIPKPAYVQARAQWSLRLPDFLSDARVNAPILLTEQLTVLQQGGSSRSDQQTRDRVIGMTVQSRLIEAASVFDAIRPVISIVEPAFERFCPGRLDVDIVPADRTLGSQGGNARSRPC